MKKYTPVFGPQELFDNAPEHVEVIRFNDYSKEYLWGDLNTVKLLTSKELKVIPIVAMRRIIKEPKQWTWEDKKAGRLPEVGWYVYSENDSKSAVVIAKDHEGDIWFQCSCGIVRCTDGYAMLPIETPTEKAQRLREEWKNNVIEIHHGKRRKMSTSTFLLDDIYDALQSGELKMPEVE